MLDCTLDDSSMRHEWFGAAFYFLIYLHAYDLYLWSIFGRRELLTILNVISFKRHCINLSAPISPSVMYINDI